MIKLAISREFQTFNVHFSLIAENVTVNCNVADARQVQVSQNFDTYYVLSYNL